MRDRRYRHLPVAVDGRAVAMVSVRDLYEVMKDELERTSGKPKRSFSANVTAPELGKAASATRPALAGRESIFAGEKLAQLVGLHAVAIVGHEGLKFSASFTLADTVCSR